jgi:hypothetical protein
MATYYLWAYEQFQISKETTRCILPTGSFAVRRYMRHAHIIWMYRRFTDTVRYRWHGWDRW